MDLSIGRGWKDEARDSGASAAAGLEVERCELLQTSPTLYHPRGTEKCPGDGVSGVSLGQESFRWDDDIVTAPRGESTAGGSIWMRRMGCLETEAEWNSPME